MKGGDSAFPAWKRAMDILLSSVALVLLAPVFLGIAAVIKFTCRVPALLKQERVGRYRKPFLLWKFRTMRVNVNSTAHENHLAALIASNTPMVKLDAAGDPRVFPFGGILRRTCMDE